MTDDIRVSKISSYMASVVRDDPRVVVLTFASHTDEFNFIVSRADFAGLAKQMSHDAALLCDTGTTGAMS
jgi:hypothetical protein